MGKIVYQNPTIINAEAFRACSIPSSVELDKARRNIIFATEHRHFGNLLSYHNGYYDSATGANNDGTFYCIFPVVDPGSSSNDKIYIHWKIKLFNKYDSTSLKIYSDGVLIDTVTVSSGYTTDTTVATGIELDYTVEVDYNKNAAGTAPNQYGYTQLRVDGGVVAYAYAYTVPTDDADYLNYSGTDFNLSNQVFNPGNVLVGALDYDSDNTITALAAGIKDNNIRTAWSSTRPCLFQWGHPAGVYVDTATSSGNIFGSPSSVPEVRVRTRKNATEYQAVIVVRHDSGTSFSVKTGQGTYSASFSTTETTPYIKIIDIGLNDTGGTGWAKFTSSGSAVEYKTIAIFEKLA